MSGFEDLSDVVDLLSTGTYGVTRAGSTTYVNGVRTITAPTTFIVDACIQPMTGLELDRQPDGFRNSEKLVCFTRTKLQTLDTGEPDTLFKDGLAYQVEKVEPWAELGNYYRAILVRPAQ